MGYDFTSAFRTIGIRRQGDGHGAGRRLRGYAAMRLTVFGSTGRTGRLLVTLATDRGHEVITLVRTPTHLVKAGDGLYYILGDVMKQQDVSRTIAGSDAVISVLGHTPTSSPDVLTAAASHVLAGMHTHGVRRLVFLSCASIGQPGDRPGPTARLAQWAVRLILRPDRKDALGALRLIQASDVLWTGVRALLIGDGPGSGSVRAGRLGEDTGHRIVREDLAAFLLDRATDATFVREAPAVSN